MKKLFLSAIITFCALSTVAQQLNTTKKGILKVNFLTPGIEYEMPLGEKTSLNFNFGTTFGFSAGTGRKTEWGVIPLLNSQYRYYYNFEKRLRKNKRIDYNSGNFLSITSILYSDIFLSNSVSLDYTGVIGPTWGLQRTSQSGFNFTLNMGAGMWFGNGSGTDFGPIIGLRLGWLLKK